MAAAPRIVFFGATGYTGELAVRAAAARGIPFTMAGRDRSRLEALQAELPTATEVVVADARDASSLDAVARPGAIVCSTVGPFGELGAPLVEACVRNGAHYLDTTGEQAWVARCLDQYGAGAEARGVVVAPSMAYEVAVCDCAAAVAARGMAEARELIIVYAVHRFGTSRGTKLSVLRAIEEPGWQWEVGERRLEPPGAQVCRGVLPEPVGPRALVSFASPEVITVPRHVRTARVRTYLAVPEALGGLLARVAPRLPALLSGRIGDFARRAVEEGPRGPAELRRKRARSTCVVVARGSDGSARSVVVHLEDPYGLTGDILVQGASNLVDGGIAPGFRAPREVARDPAAFLQLLASRGAETQMLEADLLAGVSLPPMAPS
jgi:short subunit dehydrogenase-like uncharacterized protein